MDAPLIQLKGPIRTFLVQLGLAGLPQQNKTRIPLEKNW